MRTIAPLPFGGVPQRVIYDNLKAVVEAILVGKERTFNRRFMAMVNHYLFEPVACTPASGWEKDQIENQLGNVREWLFTPLARFASFAELNDWLHAVESWLSASIPLKPVNPLPSVLPASSRTCEPSAPASTIMSSRCCAFPAPVWCRLIATATALPPSGRARSFPYAVARQTYV